MKTITELFDTSLKRQYKQKWKKLYVGIDIHGTILKPSWNKDDLGEYYNDSAEHALQVMSENDNICLIMYTSTYPDMIEKYVEFFAERGIRFDYINENPECKSNEISDFSKKIYFDILLDDHAGFDPETDWKEIFNYFK